MGLSEYSLHLEVVLYTIAIEQYYSSVRIICHYKEINLLLTEKGLTIFKTNLESC